MDEKLNESIFGAWILIDDLNPNSVPSSPGHYLVACESGKVTDSFYVTDLSWYGHKTVPSRKSNGKYSRRFEESHCGHKITHWVKRAFHPNPKFH